MFTKLNCAVSHFQDSSSEDVLFAPSDLQTTIEFENMLEQVSNRFEIAASGSLTLTFGSVGAPKGLYILAENGFDLTLTIGLNSLTIECRRSSATVASENVPVLIPAALSSIVVANPNTTTLKGRFSIWGDPA